MTLLSQLPMPPPYEGLVYFIDDAWPGAPSEAGLVMSNLTGWQAIPFATLAGHLLINQSNTSGMRSYLSLGSAATQASSAFDSSGAASSAVSTHVGLSDPHPQYQTETESDARYSQLGHNHSISDVTGLSAALAAIPSNSIGSPTSRSLSTATAYQATTTTKPSIVTVNLSSTAALTLTSGTTNTAQIVIGSTNGVASGTGTVVGNYSNSLTGTLVIGLALNTTSASPITFALPTGWYFAVRVISGSVSIGSAYDQALG